MMFIRTSCMRPNHRRLYTRYTGGGICPSSLYGGAPSRRGPCPIAVVREAISSCDAVLFPIPLLSAISSHPLSDARRRSCSSLDARLVADEGSCIDRRREGRSHHTPRVEEKSSGDSALDITRWRRRRWFQIATDERDDEVGPSMSWREIDSSVWLAKAHSSLVVLVI